MRSIRSVMVGLLIFVVTGDLRAGLAAPVPNPIIFVGNGAGCDFDTVQEAVDAAAAAPGEDVIAIANNRSYTAQQIHIDDDADLALYGGFASCPSAPSNARTTLDGTGGAAAPVITHEGVGLLELRNLTITGGDAVSAGGGLQSVGSGDLRLRNVEFVANSGGSGGGVNAVGDENDGKHIRLIEHVTFRDNAALDAGALFLLNGTIRPEGEPTVIVAENRATSGDGGGWYLRNADLDEGADGDTFGCTFVFSLNRAANRGGGLFLHARGGESHFIPKMKQDCAAAFVGNEAVVSGGAIEVFAQDDPSNANPTEAGALLLDTQLNENRAPDGAGAMVRTVAGSAPAPTAYLALVPDHTRATPSRCIDPPVSACPAMYRNRSERLDAVPTLGSTLVGIADVGAPVFLDISRAAFGHNTGQVFRVSGAQADLTLRDVLVTGFYEAYRVLSADGDANVTIDRSTFFYWGFLGAEPVMLGDRRFLIEGSIVMLTGRDYLRMRRADNTAVVRDLLIYQQQLPPGPFFQPTTISRVHSTLDAGFVDAEGGDFRLARGSVAIDRYIPSNLDFEHEPDLDHHARGYDDGTVPNAPGVIYDLGAYEQSDGVFRDGYEQDE